MNLNDLNRYQAAALLILSAEPRTVEHLRHALGRAQTSEHASNLKELERHGLAKSVQGYRKGAVAWVSTPAGEAMADLVYARDGFLYTHLDRLRARILSVCCLEPLITHELQVRLEARGVDIDARDLGRALGVLHGLGFLAAYPRVASGQWGTVKGYVLTVAGETYLDERAA